MTHPTQKIAGAVVIGIAIAFIGCGDINSTEGAKALTDSCADDQLRSSSVLYFGPSNQIGAGSIWSRLGPNGGYQPQWRVSDLKLDAKAIQPGKEFQCDFSKNRTFTTGVGLSVLSPAANVTGEIKVDLQRAKSITVSANSVAWDTVVAGPYLVELKNITDPQIRSDVFGKNRLVVRRGLRISGYKAVLDFDSSIKPELKAKYNGVKLGPKAVGEVGAEFSAKWTSDDKLELSAAQDVYVAGEFVELVNGEFVSTRGADVINDLGDKLITPYRSKP